MVLPASDKIPRVSSYSGSCSLPLPLSPTGLSPSLAVLPITFGSFSASALSQLLQPHISMVWAFPLSLAATRGITFVFFSSGYLDVSVPRVPLLFRMASLYRMPGSPIRIPARLRFLTARRRFSQFGASFFSYEWQGILRTPLPP